MLALLLVILHVRGEGGRCVVAPITDGALKGLAVVVRLHVDLEMVTRRGREGNQVN